MAALENRRHERVALSLAQGKTAEEASRDAKYPTEASSFVQNARKRAQRKDIKARAAELQTQIAAVAVIDAAWLRGRVARVVKFDVSEGQLKATDWIAAAALLAKMIPGALVPTKIAPTSPDGTEPYETSGNSDEDTIKALELFIAKAKAKTEAV